MTQRSVMSEWKNKYMASQFLTIDLNEEFLMHLEHFIALVSRQLSWTAFGCIPRGHQNGRFRLFLDFFIHLLQGKSGYRFFRHSPLQGYLLRQFTVSVHPNAELLFRFLCLNQPASRNDLERLMPAADLDHFINERFLVRQDHIYYFPVMIIPFDEHYYIADNQQVINNRSIHGVQPAHVNGSIRAHALHLRRLAAERKAGRILEMGSGLGIITLELGRENTWREGAEIYPRNLAFAQANRHLRRDDQAVFYQSDLFSNVRGNFDLIIFFPYQPTMEYIDLIERFIMQSLNHLNEQGAISLTVQARYGKNGRCEELERLAQIMKDCGLWAISYCITSYFSIVNEEKMLEAQSLLLIERAPEGQAGVIREVFDCQRLGFKIHQTFQRLFH